MVYELRGLGVDLLICWFVDLLCFGRQDFCPGVCRSGDLEVWGSWGLKVWKSEGQFKVQGSKFKLHSSPQLSLWSLAWIALGCSSKFKVQSSKFKV